MTIINRSEVVGRPLAALLANDGATVYSVDIHDILLFERGQGLRKHVVRPVSFAYCTFFEFLLLLFPRFRTRR